MVADRRVEARLNAAGLLGPEENALKRKGRCGGSMLGWL